MMPLNNASPAFEQHYASHLDCWDAPTESLWGRLKVGRLYGGRFATRREAMDEVIDWLTFYNYQRLHPTLGYVSPMTFEQRWIAAKQQGRKFA